MKHIKLLIAFVLLFAALTPGCRQENQTARDWPQFLGPDRNSTSEQTGILRSWPETGPEVLWSVDLGKGFGGPVIKDGKVYLLDRDDEVGDFMRCFDLSTGEELWKYGYDAPGTVMFPGSRSVPAVDGNYVYSCGHNGDLYCIDITTHEPVWNKNVWTDFGGERLPSWAITQNPLVYGDLLIIASQAPEAGVVAYDKLTGDLKWKTPSLGPVGYVSPAIVRISGEDHVVMITAAERENRGERPPMDGQRQQRPAQGGGTQAGPPQGGQRQAPQGAQGQAQGDQRQGPPPEFRPTLSNGLVAGINPLTGEKLWEYKNFQCIIPIPSAYDAGENKVLIIAGYNAGVAMIRVDKNADGQYAVTELYKNPEFGEHTKPPVFHNGYFYAQYSNNERRDGLVCMSMDGRVMWKTMRNPSFDKGSMILADGLILASDGAQSLYLIEPDSTGFKPLASAELLAGGTGDERRPNQNWGTLALADGNLLMRDQTRMICVKVAK